MSPCQEEGFEEMLHGQEEGEMVSPGEILLAAVSDQTEHLHPQTDAKNRKEVTRVIRLGKPRAPAPESAPATLTSFAIWKNA